jgi:hypothetical protein
MPALARRFGDNWEHRQGTNDSERERRISTVHSDEDLNRRFYEESPTSYFYYRLSSLVWFSERWNDVSALFDTPTFLGPVQVGGFEADPEHPAGLAQESDWFASPNGNPARDGAVPRCCLLELYLRLACRPAPGINCHRPSEASPVPRLTSRAYPAGAPNIPTHWSIRRPAGQSLRPVGPSRPSKDNQSGTLHSNFFSRSRPAGRKRALDGGSARHLEAGAHEMDSDGRAGGRHA